MPNITLSISDSLMKKAREAARRQSMSLNGLVRSLLEERVRGGGEWLDGLFARADKSGSGTRGKKWKREDLYD
jgi:hypothetical protein